MVVYVGGVSSGNFDELGSEQEDMGRKMQLLNVMIVVVCLQMLWSSSEAQLIGQTCDLETEFSMLVPCLPFLQMQEEEPSQDCCVKLHDVLKNHFPCICTLVDGASGAGGMVGQVLNEMNFTLAMELPSLCGVRGFDPSSQCGSFGGIGSSPVFSNPHFSSSISYSIPTLAWLGILAMVTLMFTSVLAPQ